MSENHLDNIIEGIKKTLAYKDGEYITVIITVLIGEEEEVLEAEGVIYDNIDPDDLACKSARIKLGDWKGKKWMEENVA